MNWFTTAGQGGARDAGDRPGADAMCGNAVMYDAGKIITFGGAPAYSESAAVANSVLITLTGTTVATKTVGALKRARGFAHGIVLPDGKVLAVGGQARPNPFSDDDPALEAGVSRHNKTFLLAFQG
jgi:galactose oxidase